MKEEPSNDHDKTSKDGDVCGGACSKVLKILGLHNSTSSPSSSSKIREVFDDDVGKMSMRQVIKILVLGPGDSGKSTVLKQIGLINGNNYTDSEKLKFKPTIIRNILDSLLSLQNAMNTFSLNFEDANNEENMECLVECRKRIAMDNMDDWNENCESYLPKMKSIWADPSIRMCLERRNLFYLSDSIDYFMSNLPRICKKTYIPETDDILRARQPTTAIREYKYKISSSYFLFVDVGGQRSERRKWLNCFENVTSILFIASLSDYDLYLSKEELLASNSQFTDVNRMRDALNLFKTLINWKKNEATSENARSASSRSVVTTTQPARNERGSLLFDKVAIILFLNKKDLFEKKFGHSSIKTCFPDYDESLSCDASKAFIANKFIECNSDPKREIYFHYTFALDRDSMKTVVESVRDRIIKYMLESMRL